MTLGDWGLLIGGGPGDIRGRMASLTVEAGPGSGRLGHLEAVRGLAALQVVLTHLAAAFHPFSVFGAAGVVAGAEGRHADWESLAFQPPFGFLLAGQFAVCLFFVLSGFVLSRKHCGPGTGSSAVETDRALREAMLKRYVRLGGVVAFSVLLAQGLKSAGWMWNVPAAVRTGSVWFGEHLSQATSLGTAVRCILFNLFPGSVAFNAPMWSIGTELMGSYLVFLVLWVSRRSPWRGWFYAALWFGYRGTFYPLFLVGLMVADLEASHPQILARLLRPGVCVVLLGVGIHVGGYPGHVGLEAIPAGGYQGWLVLPHVRGGWSAVGAILVFLAILRWPLAVRWLGGRPLVFLGGISFALYAVHLPVLCSLGAGCFLVLEPAWGYGPAAGLASVATLTASALLAVAVHRWVDDPVVCFSHRMARAFCGASFRATPVRGSVGSVGGRDFPDGPGNSSR